MQKSAYVELPSVAMQAIYNTIRQVGKSNIPLFITGEPGVGKESLARYIHESGPRRDQPFMAINCVRFYEELLQSELFGHEVGAFATAIRQRRSAFEVVNGGVLFLDEVHAMSLGAQKKLLRFLDTASFTRLGGNEVLMADVHIIAATNKDIVKAVAEKAFREDLYFSLRSMTLHLPPLREHPVDIPPLVEAFISEFAAESGKNVAGIHAQAENLLQRAAWSGNIRQLRSAVQVAVALCTTQKLEAKDFPGISSELAEALLSIWQTLPSQTRDAIWKTLPQDIQHTLRHELSMQYIGHHIENMNQHQILRAVARRRIQQYPTLREAAKSLDIDIRTLQRYARHGEYDD